MVEVHIPSASQKALLDLSRQTLEDFVRGSEPQPKKVEDPYLKACDYGVFVSLHNRGELRGCVGVCTPIQPLYQAVIEMTRAAASRDHRMSPIVADELADIHIDISVLSPLEVASDPLSLEVGTHGLHVIQKDHRGVLLPRVAVEYRWDMKTFIEHACLKAGLPKNAWMWSDTRISSFTALVIEEKI